MKYIWIFLSGLVPLFNLAAPEVLTLANCKCAEGYQPQKFDDDRIECAGINVYNTEPCNQPTPPACKCSGDVSGILIDASGIWCSSFSKGKERRKWPCENEEEWSNFKSSNLH